MLQAAKNGRFIDAIPLSEAATTPFTCSIQGQGFLPLRISDLAVRTAFSASGMHASLVRSWQTQCHAIPLDNVMRTSFRKPVLLRKLFVRPFACRIQRTQLLLFGLRHLPPRLGWSSIRVHLSHVLKMRAFMKVCRIHAGFGMTSRAMMHDFHAIKGPASCMQKPGYDVCAYQSSLLRHAHGAIARTAFTSLPQPALIRSCDQHLCPKALSKCLFAGLSIDEGGTTYLEYHRTSETSLLGQRIRWSGSYVNKAHRTFGGRPTPPNHLIIPHFKAISKE